MKNTQVAVLCGAILVGALIDVRHERVAGALARSSRTPRRRAAQAAPAGKRLVIAMMPKAKGDPYFVSCLRGAEEAARELGVELIWDGPTGLDAARQNEMVENWITRGVDVIAVAVENRRGISTVLRKARARGIKVLTWDADAEPDARDYFVNQATAEGIGQHADRRGRAVARRQAASLRSSPARLSAANQNEWIANIKKRLAEKYPAADAGHDSSERRRPRQGVRRDADASCASSRRSDW